jgi:acetyl/propionyl-CoA carboxylase alpha subunit
MLRALDEYIVQGIKTSVDVHKRLLVHKDFIDGNTFTDFFERHKEIIFAKEEKEVPDEVFIAAALSELIGGKKPVQGSFRETVSPWTTIGKWEIGSGDGA